MASTKYLALAHYLIAKNPNMTQAEISQLMINVLEKSKLDSKQIEKFFLNVEQDPIQYSSAFENEKPPEEITNLLDKKVDKKKDANDFNPEPDAGPDLDSRKAINETAKKIIVNSYVSFAFTSENAKKNLNVTIDRAIQILLRPEDKEENKKFNQKLLHNLYAPDATKSEKREAMMMIIDDLLSIDSNELTKPRSDADFVEYYSDEQNYKNLMKSVEIENYILLAQSMGMEKEVIDTLHLLDKAINPYGAFTQNRLAYIATDFYPEFDMLSLLKSNVIVPENLINEIDTDDPYVEESLGTLFKQLDGTGETYFNIQLVACDDYEKFGVTTLLSGSVGNAIEDALADSNGVIPKSLIDPRTKNFNLIRAIDSGHFYDLTGSKPLTMAEFEYNILNNVPILLQSNNPEKSDIVITGNAEGSLSYGKSIFPGPKPVAPEQPGFFARAWNSIAKVFTGRDTEVIANYKTSLDTYNKRYANYENANLQCELNQLHNVDDYVNYAKTTICTNDAVYENCQENYDKIDIEKLSSIKKKIYADMTLDKVKNLITESKSLDIEKNSEKVKENVAKIIVGNTLIQSLNDPANDKLQISDSKDIDKLINTQTKTLMATEEFGTFIDHFTDKDAQIAFAGTNTVASIQRITEKYEASLSQNNNANELTDEDKLERADTYIDESRLSL